MSDTDQSRPDDVQQPEVFNRFQMRWLKKEMEALHKRIDEMLARHKAIEPASYQMQQVAASQYGQATGLNQPGQFEQTMPGQAVLSDEPPSAA